MTPDTTPGFSARLGELRSEMQEISRLGESFGSRLVTSLASAVTHGRSLSDVMRGLALSLANQALSQALRPLGALFGGSLKNADGNVNVGGRVMPFADGGIVNSPVMFPLRNGTGLMGEAGPEAIMPLARGADGKLGVRGAGGGTHVTVNITTPDVQAFRQSQSQIAAQMSRALARGQRNI